MSLSTNTVSTQYQPRMDGIWPAWTAAPVILLAVIIFGNQCVALWMTRFGEARPVAEDVVRRLHFGNIRHARYKGFNIKAYDYRDRTINGLQSPVGRQFPVSQPSETADGFEMVELFKSAEETRNQPAMW